MTETKKCAHCHSMGCNECVGGCMECCRVVPVSNYERVSHTHCWDNQPSPCGIPLEKHTQCCLCDLKVPVSEDGKTWTANRGVYESDATPTPPPTEGWRKEFDELCEKWQTPGYYAFADFIESKIEQALAEQKARMIEVVEGMKCTERKVHNFGDWAAATYQEKELVNAVLKDIIKSLSK